MCANCRGKSIQRREAKTDWNFTYKGEPFDSERWADLKSHQPFYAQINFQETHRAYHGDKRADPAKVEIPPWTPDHPVARADWARYLDAATELDRKVGLILKQLEADGLADNTVIVFFGDNGQSHVRGKQFCYDEGFLVPLIIRWPKNASTPKNFQPGAVSDRLIAAIDLAPTMLEIAEAKKPAKMEGEIFLGEHSAKPRQYVFGARDRCDETVFRFRTVRDARYRYIRNFTPDRPFLQANEYKARAYPVWNLLPQLHSEGKLTPPQEFLCAPTMPEEELYDNETDPFEITISPSQTAGHQAIKRLRSFGKVDRQDTIKAACSNRPNWRPQRRDETGTIRSRVNASDPPRTLACAGNVSNVRRSTIEFVSLRELLDWRCFPHPRTRNQRMR
jgi:hypothetical protein